MLISLGCKIFQAFLLSNYFITKALVNVRLYYERTERMRNVTIEKMERELSKTYALIEELQKKARELEEEKQMAEDARTMKMIKKFKISSERLQLLNSLSEDEILQFLELKEKENQVNEKTNIN